jgi:predicted O-methyltransferase YrrM
MVERSDPVPPGGIDELGNDSTEQAVIEVLRAMKRVLRALKRKLVGSTDRPIPLRARHVEYSAIVSLDDDPAKPSDRLIDLALRAAHAAQSISMAAVVARMTQPPYYPDVWPGEHYRLLAGLVSVCQPQVIVEIGTSTGLSALAMRQLMPSGARLITFDVIPWDKFPDTCLRTEDFENGALMQMIGDVSDSHVMRQHEDLFRSADIIFADGPKDGRFERLLIDRLMELKLPQRPLLVFDDIRLWNMLAIWRNIKRPKLDVTSFGHWSGTGFVDWIPD